MLKIRLRRTGARKRPNYRVVVTEVSAPRDGRAIEIIGFYDPLTEPSTFRIDGEKAKRWMSHGAQPTERVAKLLAREGIIEARPWAGKSMTDVGTDAGTAESAAPEPCAEPVAVAASDDHSTDADVTDAEAEPAPASA